MKYTEYNFIYNRIKKASNLQIMPIFQGTF